jgi:hypothetical protein
MQSISFQPGSAYLASISPGSRWTVVFEDEGTAGYFYARDGLLGEEDDAILDGMLIYNLHQAPQRELLASIQWSRNGEQAVLYIDGSAQALFDFAARRGYCRSGFPNFLDQGHEGWNVSSHDWSDMAWNAFESDLAG